jgi:ATP-dependent Clp protease ATP-binding subunit ClpA
VPGSVGLLILERHGISPERIRNEVEAILAPEEQASSAGGNGEIEPTERARATLALATDEARQWKHGYVGVEHLLIGMLLEGEGAGAQLLARLDVTVDGARAELKRHLEGMTVMGYGLPGDGPVAPYPSRTEATDGADGSESAERGAASAP